MARTPADSASPAASEPPSRPKTLPKHLPLVTEIPDLVPARMINEVLYCERLMYLEWAQGEFTDNAFTVEGRATHKRADQARGDLPPKAEPSEGTEADRGKSKSKKGKRAAQASEDESRGDEDDELDVLLAERPYEARSLWLSSERLGITAKIDVVEGDESGTVVPIEYKRGAVPDVPEGAYLPERAQVAAQALVLRDHGYRCDEGAIYFAKSKRRVAIPITQHLEETVRVAVERARAVVAKGEAPPPLEDSPKCYGCSLSGICLPDETNLLRALDGQPFSDEPAQTWAIDEDLTGPLEPDPWNLVGPQPDPERTLRRLHPARDDKLPIYVQEAGAQVGLSGERLVIRSREKPAIEARLSNTSQLALYGAAQVTTPALRALLERGIPVSFFSYGGWYYGRAGGFDTKNIELRVAQFRAAMDPATCLRFARGFVASKIRNCRTLLRRNHEAPSAVTLSELEQLAKKAEAAESLESLLGIEGTAARYYFGDFTGMLKGEARSGDFDLNGRNRRPPRDPINALLSFSYALLTKEFTLTLGAVGLEALLGFYHQPRFGRPALALDLMEEFRPLIADSVVLGALNNGVITSKDFIVRASGVSLKPSGRKNFLLAFERRMDQLVTHPVFGYRVSYRRVIEVQARLLGQVLLGEIPTYPSFRTR